MSDIAAISSIGLMGPIGGSSKSNSHFAMTIDKFPHTYWNMLDDSIKGTAGRVKQRAIYFSKTLFDIMSAATFEVNNFFMKNTSWISARESVTCITKDQRIRSLWDFALAPEKRIDGAFIESMRSKFHNPYKTTILGRTRTKDKYRVVYSDHQRLELEKEFHYSRYITIRRKAELANGIGLSERQVRKVLYNCHKKDYLLDNFLLFLDTETWQSFEKTEHWSSFCRWKFGFKTGEQKKGEV